MSSWRSDVKTRFGNSSILFFFVLRTGYLWPHSLVSGYVEIALCGYCSQPSKTPLCIHSEFDQISNALGSNNFGQVTSAFDPQGFQFGGKLYF